MTTKQLDRSALVRRAMVEVVAARGLYGASMSLVAKQAGVATGTAYVHYDSKEDLLVAAFVEVKRKLAEAGLRDVHADRLHVDGTDLVEERNRQHPAVDHDFAAANAGAYQTDLVGRPPVEPGRQYDQYRKNDKQ